MCWTGPNPFPLEQTEHDFENVLFCLFVRLAISGTLLWTVGLSLSNGHILGNQTVLRLPNCGFSGCRPDLSGRPKLDSISAINNICAVQSSSLGGTEIAQPRQPT